MTGCDIRTAFQGENFSLNNSRGIPLNNLGLRSSVNYDKDQPDFWRLHELPSSSFSFAVFYNW